MTATAAPISATAEQQHQHNDNQDQFHWISPLMAMALFARHLSIQRHIQTIVPGSRATRAESIFFKGLFSRARMRNDKRGNCRNAVQGSIPVRPTVS
jgi:hypothetical protein